MGTKGVNNAARPPEGSPVESRSLVVSSLPLFPFGASLWPGKLFFANALWRQTFVWPVYISATSSHVNSSRTIHFNSRVCWQKIRVRTTSWYRYILLHNSVISRTLVGGGLTPVQDAVSVLYNPNRLGFGTYTNSFVSYFVAYVRSY